jgi:FAD:protein FMN transferase
MDSLEFRAMNTTVLMAIEATNGAEAALSEAQALVEDYERRFSRFLPESELSRLNAMAGQWVQVSDELFELLALSKAYYEETAGLFDPSILPDLKRAGYDASFELVKSKEDAPQGEPRNSTSRHDFSGLELDAAKTRVRMPEGLEIDLGGIAKGWIVERAAVLLRQRGNAGAVSAGGDIFFSGVPGNGEPWRVEIEDPREPDRTVAVVRVGEGAVVTSSVSKRTWSQAGHRRHHLIDPRTREPAETDWLSTTAIAPSADLAEAYAKAVLIGGKREIKRLILQRPQVSVLCVDYDGQVWGSSNSKEYVYDSNHIFQGRQDPTHH